MEGNTAPVRTAVGGASPVLALALLLCAGLFAACLASLYIGSQDVSVAKIFRSFTAYDPANVQEMIVRTLRLPRLLAALLCGASFAVAGALMQGVTNNPMASPSILGISAGAGFGLAVFMILFPQGSLSVSLLFSIAGAGLATLAIFFLAQAKGAGRGPVFLALAGTAIGAVFGAVTQAMTVYFEVAQDLSYWTAGGISGVRMEQALFLLPWTVAGLALAMSIARSVTLLSFGEEVAIGLGSKIGRIRLVAGVTVLLLAGSAVAVAGPVGFVGLVTPHIARKIVGIDYRKVIPVSALSGALLVTLADIAARTIHPPFETPLGAVTALIGVPFFLYLIRRGRNRR